ncbi:MAG: type II secretion system ATPase GspE [Thermodesulfobacteriota bacterium]
MNIQLFEILKQTAGVTRENLDELQKLSEEKGGRISELLIKRKIITEKQFLEALSIQYQIPFMPILPLNNIRNEFTRQVPIQFLKKYVMVPLGMNSDASEADGRRERPADAPAEPIPAGNTAYLIAINDPAQLQPLDDLVRLLKLDAYRIVLSTKDAILSVINLSYDLGGDSAEQLVQDMEENGQTTISVIEDTADLLDDTSDAPIIKLVNHIISQSVKARASDIHFEPYQDRFKVRYRVDGILYDLLTPPKWIQPALISRIKVMAKMNIAEKRLPQDGRLEVKIGDQDIDVRVSTIPTSFGERLVLRLLNKTGSLLKLAEIGLSSEKLALLEELVQSPNGIILVTGPTGSGKTTTLYAILTSINTPEINIITIEDPIEYQIKGISQIQVNPKINLTFAKGLRSIVRQDPDVVLVGEIRDHETAEIAVQSALTGHLVFSTLHTNDSASAITRLVDIGVEPFLISSSVVAVVAQRLIRVLCNECKEAHLPDETELKSMEVDPDRIKNRPIYRAKGCPHCFHTGYRGRIGIFEILVLNNALRSLVLKTFDSNLIKAEALKHNLITLRRDGIQKVLDGITTIEEVLRVIQK